MKKGPRKSKVGDVSIEHCFACLLSVGEPDCTSPLINALKLQVIFTRMDEQERRQTIGLCGLIGPCAGWPICDGKLIRGKNGRLGTRKITFVTYLNQVICDTIPWYFNDCLCALCSIAQTTCIHFDDMEDRKGVIQSSIQAKGIWQFEECVKVELVCLEHGWEAEKQG